MKVQSIQNVIFAKKINFSARKNNSFYTKPLEKDSYVFSLKNSNTAVKPISISSESGNKVIKNLSGATSGHRAPWLSETFDPKAVELIALGVAQYAKENSLKNGKPTVIIGGDTREATRKSLPQIKDILLKQGIDVIYIKNPTPTPLIAMCANKFNLGISILMTASHNPWSDGGFNFLTSDGAVAPTSVTSAIGKNMEEILKKGAYKEEIKPTGEVYEFNPYELYKKELESTGLIDFEKIKNSGVMVYYDGLNGAGNYVMPKLLRDYGIPFEHIVSSGQIGPNPTAENLKMLSNYVENSDEKLRIGLSNDGDADRFGIVDEDGEFISANDVLLLASYHLIKNKGLSGDIIRNQNTTLLLEKLGQKYGLITHETPVGFKYLAHDILQARDEGRDIIIAGEDSGGMTAHGCIPEKDGILADFLILDLVATEKKPLSEILKNIKNELGFKTHIESYSKRFKNESVKNRVMEKAQTRYNDALRGDVDFGERHQVDTAKTIKTEENIKSYKPQGDGFKFVMTDDSTVLIRKGGTEPLVRFCIEASGQNDKETKENAQALKEYIETNIDEDE